MKSHKHQLLASTALATAVMFSSSALAQEKKEAMAEEEMAEEEFEPVAPHFTLGGFYFFDAHFADVDGVDDRAPVQMEHDMEVHFNAVGELDNGIMVTGHVEFEGAGGARVDDHWITVDGGWGRVMMGATDAVSGKTQVTAPASAYGVTSGLQTDWFHGSVADGDTKALHPCPFRCALGGARLHAGTDDTGVHYFSPRFNGFAFAVGFRPEASGAKSENKGPIDETMVHHNAVDGALTYQGEMSGIGISASAATGMAAAPEGEDDISYVTSGLRLSAMGFTVGGHIANESTDSMRNGNSFGLGVSYGQGPWTVAADMFSGSIRGTDAPGDHEYDAWAIGGQYVIGPGLRVLAGYQSVSLDRDDMATADGTAFTAGVAVNF
ncbi:MAG: porin [Rhodospirillaceae bacterium]|nr:porin [Rhodospirillaceae bacterium]